MLAAVAMAKERIDFQFYIFELGLIGRQFIDALGEAAARGVRVRVLIDGLGSQRDGLMIAEHLELDGAEVKIYHPLPWLTPLHRWSRQRGNRIRKAITFLFKVNRRNHQKLCIVDSHRVWTGSINISDTHLATDLGGQGWRDYAISMEGEGASALARSFDDFWDSGRAQTGKGFLTRYLHNKSLVARRLKNRFFVERIRSAQRRLWIASAYFAPPGAVRRALITACQRGVDVRLILSLESDVPMFPGISRCYYSQLLKAGAKIYEYRPAVLHAKVLLSDDICVLGSSNINYRSFFHDLELDAVLDDEDVLRDLERELGLDMQASRVIGPADAKGLSWNLRLLHYLRYWM
ncbi:MAG: cardiolipin synthase [Halieaceae bacterium]|jgi:cardiolipin synthase